MLNKIRKNLKDKAGFTLVELIVVLVILAILAALLVPALTGYIDKANKQKIVATTRQVVMAAQTETSEAYAKAVGGKLTDKDTLTLDKNTKPSLQTIVELAEVGTYSGDTFSGKNGVSKVVITVTADGKVSTVVVTQSGYKCTYNMNETGDEQYKVNPASATSGSPD